VTVDLTEFAPAECPHGHVLRIGRNPSKPFIGGRVAVSWVMCGCAGGRSRGAPFGHIEVLCAQCPRDETGWRYPACAVKPDAS
jgi:hypothetical protein